jgi:hypothetical protein
MYFSHKLQPYTHTLFGPVTPYASQFFPIILFGSTTVLTGMTGNSLHMQWPLPKFQYLFSKLSIFILLYIKNHNICPNLETNIILTKISGGTPTSGVGVHDEAESSGLQDPGPSEKFQPSLHSRG